jgi:hypothetical protein
METQEEAYLLKSRTQIIWMSFLVISLFHLLILIYIFFMFKAIFLHTTLWQSLCFQTIDVYSDCYVFSNYIFAFKYAL